MKARVQREQKLRDARAASEARKHRSSSRRNHSADEIEESGMTDDWNTSDSNNNDSQDDQQEDTELVPFAAAEPLPQTSSPGEENHNASNADIIPDGTVSASSAEVLSGEGRRQDSSSSDSSDEDASVLSLRAEATPIHDHQQPDHVDSLERENQELRDQLEHERRQSYDRQSLSSETKNRQRFSKKCKLITAVLFVILFAGAGAFFVTRSSATPSFPFGAKQISIPPTFAPTPAASAPKTDPPTQELVYEPPTREDCDTMRSGGRLEGEEGFRVSRYNVELDAELTPTATVEDVLAAMANATQQILIPDLVGCLGTQRRRLSHFQLRRGMIKRIPRYNPNRYAIATGNSTIRLAVGRSCESGSGGPCLGIDVILHLTAKNAQEKQFVFQSLIIETFGPNDLATTLGLDALLTSIKLIDVKINSETDSPSDLPTNMPTLLVSQQPSDLPSLVPSRAPTKSPTATPTQVASRSPTTLPSQSPSHLPSSTPTTGMPSSDPSAAPSRTPTHSPSVSINPTVSPTVTRSLAPTSTVKPSTAPTVTQAPTTPNPTERKPTETPSEDPTFRPIFRVPTSIPTEEPEVVVDYFSRNHQRSQLRLLPDQLFEILLPK